MSKDGFVRAVRDVPGVAAIVDEHMADYGELLCQLLMADLERLAEDLFRTRDTATLGQLLTIVDDALRTGDDYLVNAVAVSFVEHAAVWDPASTAFVATWPAALAAEADRQRRWAPPA